MSSSSLLGLACVNSGVSGGNDGFPQLGLARTIARPAAFESLTARSSFRTAAASSLSIALVAVGGWGEWGRASAGTWPVVSARTAPPAALRRVRRIRPR